MSADCQSSPPGERRYSTSDVAKPKLFGSDAGHPLQIPPKVRSHDPPPSGVEAATTEFPLRMTQNTFNNSNHQSGSGNSFVITRPRKESIGGKSFRMSKAKQFFQESLPKLKLSNPHNDQMVEITAKELARQLTLISASNFRSINRKELEKLGWTGPHRKITAPCITKMTLLFNQIASWVAKRILSCEKIQHRLQTLSFFINVANVCLQLDNYDGVRAIMSGLQSASVYRLGRTWALLGRVEREIFAKLEELTTVENNSEKYRKKISLSSPPLVPYLGINLSDLTYVYECIKKDKDNSERKAQYKERTTQFDQMLEEIANLQHSCVYSYVTDLKLILALEAEYNVTEEELGIMPEKHYQMSLSLEEKNLNAQQEEHDSIGSTVEKTFASLRGYKFTEKITEFTSKLRPPTNLDGDQELPSGPDDYALSQRRPARPKLDSVFSEQPSIQPQIALGDRQQKHVSLEVRAQEQRAETVRKTDSMVGSKSHLLKYIGKQASSSKTSGKHAPLFGSMNNLNDNSPLSTEKSHHSIETQPLGSTHIHHTTSNSSDSVEMSGSTDKLKQRFSGMVINTSMKPLNNKMESLSAVTEKPPASILLNPFLPITETPGNARLHLEGVLFKKEEFDEQGEKAAKILRTWAQFNVVLEGNQVTFSTYNASSQHTANQKTGKIYDGALSSVPRNLQCGLPTTGSLINMKNFLSGGVGGGSTYNTSDESKHIATKEVSLSRGTDVTMKSNGNNEISLGNLYPNNLTDEEKSRTLPGKGKGQMRDMFGKMLSNNHPKGFSNVSSHPLQRAVSHKQGKEQVVETAAREMLSVQPHTTKAETIIPIATGRRGSWTSILSRSLSRELDEKPTLDVEVFRIDNFCTVNPVPEHRKKFVFRAMFSQQRSFLLRAGTENEMQLWIQALRMAIGGIAK